MNTGEPWPDPFWAERRVRRMQAKLHLWATNDPGRRFDDLYNLIHHPDFLTVAWARVSGNKGARSPGVDRVVPAAIGGEAEVTAFLNDTREQLKARVFTPLPVRERMIPKAGSPGKFRRLGIPSAMDRLVQAALVLVLEPIFEADFQPVSYGFRPKRRAQDAIAEIHAFGSRNYHWVFEADITACFDELSHAAILGRVRRRVGDKRVLTLVKAFLKAGIMSEAGQVEGTASGTPQGGIASPLLANIALSALDEYFCAKDDHGTRWQREKHRKNGGAYYRIIRYADDFAIMVCGSKAHADALWDEVADVLAPLGLRLSESKTRVVHLDEGFVFLGFHIQRRTKAGTSKKTVYTYPSKKALLSIMAKVRALTNRSRHLTLEALLRQLNPVLRGWCTYFRHGVSKATFHYLDAYAWRRVTAWLRKRHLGITWKELYRRFLTGRPGNRPADNGIIMFDTMQVEVTRYRWRADNIPTPWTGIVAAIAAT
ncbi:group II intron reverse transcriptase/maturase [Actinomadura sp. KC345]|uniref:group II intron reverse transcriptase/maturase n=1 Tax=Actinomadura sp. KC345 TaxID=2530371 RepID=UPI001A9F7CAB|nr:group II intron reverse transcriptase/maturase [Actinomadura sp. KC345]